MLQRDKAEDFMLSTGSINSVRDFVTMTFKAVGIETFSTGEGIDEKIINRENGKIIVQVNPEFYRPAEVDILYGNPTKAREILGWTAKTRLEELCRMMVARDLERNK